MAVQKKSTKSKNLVSEKTLRQQQGGLLNAAEGGASRKEINDRNRNFGKAVERNVAKILDSENGSSQRVPGSGAFKFSNKNLTGDVEVRDASGREFLKVECKGVSTLTPKGDRTFTLRKDVLDQAFKEARDAQELAAVWIHWLGVSYEQEDHVVVPGDEGEAHALIPSSMFIQLVELAKLGSVVEEKGFTSG